MSATGFQPADLSACSYRCHPSRRAECLTLESRLSQTDHDGVLEFGDFCNLMLLVGGRVNATYYESQLVRMFRKVDVNSDNLIDLNEFLWMQVPQKGERPGPNNAEADRAAAEHEAEGDLYRRWRF